MNRMDFFFLLLVSLAVSVGAALAVEDPEKATRREAIDTEALEQAVAEIVREAAEVRDEAPCSRTDSDEETAETSAGREIEPPPGASHIPPAEKATAVVGRPNRVKRSMEKATPEGKEDPLSHSPAQGRAPDDWRVVSFSSGSFTPPSGVDPEMISDVIASGGEKRRFVYGFLLMDEYLNEETRAEIEALGITILGPHSNLYKAKFPRDIDLIERVVLLPYVEWVGYSMPEQKLSRDLQRVLAEESDLALPFKLPVMINLFASDGDETFKRLLEAAGAIVGRYDSDLRAYRAAVSPKVIEQIMALDFVLFVELIRGSAPSHDQSMSTIGADYIRPGGAGTNYDGSSITLGIMDSGFMMGGAAATMHQDLNKNGCGVNYTDDAAGVWNDENGHGTHVLTTICGTGTADSRYRGVATGIGSSASNRIRAAKIWRSTGGSPSSAWMLSAMDFMDDSSACSGSSPLPQVINISGGGYWGSPLAGTDDRSRKLDEKVWTYGQLYVVAAGNDGSGSQTVGAPGVGKNALTVGNVLDHGYLTVGDIRSSSSRGPTADDRMKPNLVAPGNWVTSAAAGTTNQYTTMSGTSMATPHVSGLAATLMEHYTEFQWRPYLLRAHLMASSILHDDLTTPSDNNGGGRNTYGLGRVSTYIAHWARSNTNGWSTHWVWGTVTDTNWIQRDITVPAGTDRLVVVTTWDEPAASAGASEAVLYDLDLWVDQNADCTPDSIGQCGEYASQSNVDNVEYLIINNPPAGTYRLKTIPWNAPASGLPVGIAAVVIEGDPTPTMNLSASASTSYPVVGSTFTVTTTVTSPAYVVSGVHLARTGFPSGLTLEGVQTTREDGVTMDFGTVGELTLGNIHESDTRFVVWTFRANTSGEKTLSFRTWSENGGTRAVDVTVFPGAIFMDGFESGNTSAWSSTVP